MKSIEIEELIAEFAPIVREFVDSVKQELRAEIDIIKSHQPEKGEKGEPGESVAVEVIDALIAEKVSAIPAPKDGEKGKDGEDGKDADPEFIKQLVAEELAKLPAPKDGENGKDGESVPVEEVERMVAEAVEKAVSAIKVPVDGRDALAIEVLPTIDPEKSYPRGTFAAYEGGIWRAFETTHGMRGWEVLVKGEAQHETYLEDGRTLVTRTKKTGEDWVEKREHLAIPVFRDYWTDGVVAQEADVFSCNGSLWISLENNNKARPSTGDKSWKLIVKRGRDGKGRKDEEGK